MKVPQEEKLIGAGVYDSSRGTSVSNWKWSNVTIDRAWEGVAALIHQGWPTNEQAFSDKQAFLNEKAAMLGMIRGRDSLWLYRVYPADRDPDRPGRYFFVILRLSSFEQILHPRVAGLLAYFEEERGLPLNTTPLEGEWPDKEVDMNLSDLLRECEVMPSESHWGVDGNGRVLSFKYVSWEAEAQKVYPGNRVVRKVALALGAGVSITALSVALKSWSSGVECDPPKKSMPDKPMPEPEDIDPPDRATVQPGTDDDSSPADQILDDSPQPLTESPEDQIDP
jgi:hypothetical protein